MSTTYEFRCLDCKDPLDLGDRSNHAGDAAAVLLLMAPELALLGTALQKPGRRDAVERIAGLDALPLADIAAWFARHQDHDVRLFDEYGAAHGKCGALVECSGGCGHWRHCRLSPAHEGDHQP